ncbi:MAG TPA: hypothetical protein VGY31_09910 [Terriglobia bacterium]|nr:hypothetical protein [Terriglobia bacterium]
MNDPTPKSRRIQDVESQGEEEKIVVLKAELCVRDSTAAPALTDSMA